MTRIPYPDPVDDATKRMAAQVAETMFGLTPDARVHALRRSILGDEAGPGTTALSGLMAAVAGEVKR